MKEQALRNGFNIESVNIEDPDDPFGYEAASKWVLTPEMLEEMRKNDLKVLLSNT